MQVTNAKLFPRLSHEDTVPRNLLAAIEQHLALAAGLFHRLTYLLAHYKQKNNNRGGFHAQNGYIDRRKGRPST